MWQGWQRLQLFPLPTLPLTEGASSRKLKICLRVA